MRTGRPPDARRIEYAERFGLSKRQRRHLSIKFMDRLDKCRDDEARRILLGISNNYVDPALLATIGSVPFAVAASSGIPDTWLTSLEEEEAAPTR